VSGSSKPNGHNTRDLEYVNLGTIISPKRPSITCSLEWSVSSNKIRRAVNFAGLKLTGLAPSEIFLETSTKAVMELSRTSRDKTHARKGVD